MGLGERPAKAKVEARSTGIRKLRKVDASTGLQLEQRLAEALEQHAAISEILQVISASPSDVQPVLDAVAERAARLCEAPLARVLLVDRDVLRLMAEYSLDGAPQAGTVPLPLRRSSISGRAILDCATIHHDDVVPLLDSEYPDALNARRLGIRAALAVPLMREGNAYGAIFLWRREPGLFSPKQVALVQTFAQQAAIAVDNVRLFKTTKEALEQQTATSDILRVISRSLTDVQPVFDTIVGAALNLCGASSANVVTFDGELIHVAAFAPVSPEGGDSVRHLFASYPRPPSRDTANTRAILTRSVVVIPDVLEDSEYAAGATAIAAGYRSVLSIPLMREEGVIGAITVARAKPGPFPEKQIALLKTFADQAVIAIENVRLFKETQEALEQQTATGEILRAISSSPTQLQPVLEAVVSAASRFCGAPDVMILRVDGTVLRGAAGVGQFAEIVRLREGRIDALEIPISRGSISGRAVHDRRGVHVHDLAVEREDEYPIGRELQRRFGHHTCFATPLLREGVPLGVICLFRMEVKPFSEKQTELLQTFADQAVIAIENVRLFTELQARTLQLTRSVGELKALGEVGHAVSSTLDLETVLSTIVSRATQLAGMDGGSIWEYDEATEEFYLHATDRLPDELVEVLRATPIRKG